jgi:Leucine Rich repeat
MEIDQTSNLKPFCYHCGELVEVGQASCMTCGKRLDWSSDSSPCQPNMPDESIPSEDQPISSSPERPRFQYSLRTLMIIVTLFALPCSWFAVKLQQARKQREAVEVIMQAGGNVVYDYQEASYDQSKRGFSATYSKPPSPAWLHKLLGDDFFCKVILVEGITDAGIENLKGATGLPFNRLDLRNTKITDAGLSHLEELFPELQTLDLSGTAITDAGLNHLKHFTLLHDIDLSGTKITDAGLAHIRESQIYGLELRLAGTKITDAGLEHLKTLHRLGLLDLAGSAITDTGLEQIKGLTQLWALDLKGTNITDTGIENLSKLSKLNTLSLSGTKITNAGLEHLQVLAELHLLDLHNTNVTDEGLKYIKEWKQLEGLDLGNTNVTDDGVHNLKKALPKLNVNWGRQKY